MKVVTFENEKIGNSEKHLKGKTSYKQKSQTHHMRYFNYKVLNNGKGNHDL